LTLTAGTALVILACASDTSANMTLIQMRANIAFEQSIDLHKASDVTFGGLQVRPNDKVSMTADGNMRLSGSGEILKPFGSPSVITLGDARNHMLNFATSNYTPGQGITALKAHCTVQGSGDDCSSVPLFGTKQSTLFIGMDMTIGDGLFPPGSAASPSFDMSVIYQ
jgi:hypothetical protein